MTRKILPGLLILFFAIGCTGPNPDPGATPTPTPTPTATPDPAITVVFDNQADIPVDPHFYRSGSTLTADELFASAANLYQNFNGKTTIPAKTSVTANFLLTQAATLGSNQAAFADLTTFAVGKASEKPLLHSGTDYTDRQTVTLTFSKDGNGKYHATTTVK